MKIGDMVRYRGWKSTPITEPLGLVTDIRADDSDYHRRIRVMWIGEEVPIQASALSSTGGRITTWVNPKYFEVISESR